MGVHTTAPIVTDGLIFQIDAGNPIGDHTTLITRNIVNPTEEGDFTNMSVTPIIDGLYFFDGSNDYISFGTGGTASTVRGLTKFTINAWVDSTSALTIGALDTALAQGWFLQVFGATIYGGLGSADYKQAGLPVVSGMQLLTLVYDLTLPDADKVKFYQNGVLLVSTRTILASSVSATAIDLRVGGATNYGAYYSGNIGSVSIHNRDLTALEVEQTYNSQKHKFE